MCNSINFMLTEIQVDIGIKGTNPRDATLLIHTSNWEFRACVKECVLSTLTFRV